MPVEFPANSTVDTLRCANFSIIDDDVVENVEEFTVTPSGGTFANGQDLVEVIIRDNDGMYYGLAINSCNGFTSARG